MKWVRDGKMAGRRERFVRSSSRNGGKNAFEFKKRERERESDRETKKTDQVGERQKNGTGVWDLSVQKSARRRKRGRRRAGADQPRWKRRKPEMDVKARTPEHRAVKSSSSNAPPGSSLPLSSVRVSPPLLSFSLAPFTPPLIA